MSVEKLLKDFEKKLSFGITTYSKNTIISYVDDVRLYLIKNGFEHLKIEELFLFKFEFELIERVICVISYTYCILKIEETTVLLVLSNQIRYKVQIIYSLQYY